MFSVEFFVYCLRASPRSSYRITPTEKVTISGSTSVEQSVGILGGVGDLDISNSPTLEGLVFEVKLDESMAVSMRMIESTTEDVMRFKSKMKRQCMEGGFEGRLFKLFSGRLL